ncbi:hypothetical protein AB2L27_11120 [Kineococcus sp. LSe6-4]|uniref:Uncharacterized protein n=1 Tax=Kineococcus halophytocola TaxID=3234027 RepID=A0ABV4H166_9ACTN
MAWLAEVVREDPVLADVLVRHRHRIDGQVEAVLVGVGVPAAHRELLAAVLDGVLLRAVAGRREGIADRIRAVTVQELRVLARRRRRAPPPAGAGRRARGGHRAETHG